MKRMFLILAAMALLTTPLMAQESDVCVGPSILTIQSIQTHNFPQPPPPSCVSYFFTPAALTDVSPGGQDCCIRDDTVEVYVDACLVGTIDSRNGGYGTHPFTRVGPMTVRPEPHQVTYCNTVSDTPGASGWYLDDLTPPPSDGFSNPTWTFPCSAAIDIKPNSYPNSINTKSGGVVPVAILGSATFDVSTINVTTLQFGPSGATPAHDLTDPLVLADHTQDVNSDGYLDLVSHYRQQATGIQAGDTSACITFMAGGVGMGGCDSVNAF